MQATSLLNAGLPPRALPRALQPARRGNRLQPGRLPGAWKELRFHQEHEFNLAEYVVEVQQPLGVALAPDLEGNICVVKIHDGSPAELSRVISEGDILKKCTGAWQEASPGGSDLRQIQSAILRQKEKVKLLLERREGCQHSTIYWHRCGVVGEACSFLSGLLRPLHFGGRGNQEWASSGAGRCMIATFRRTVLSEGKEYKDCSSRQERTAELRAGLADALQLPKIYITPSEGADIRSDNEVLAWNSTNCTVASNLVPYNRPQQSNGYASHYGGAELNEESINEGYGLVTPILPWLLVSFSGLSQDDLVDLAGRNGLECLLELQLDPCDGGLALVGSCWKSTRADAFTTVLGTLHRLVIRRQCMLKDTNTYCNSCSILLNCKHGMEGPVSGLVAAYCYLYGYMGYEESIKQAEMVMQARAPRELLRAVTTFLKEKALERHSTVVVSWRYGGRKVEIAGELVGGWNNRLLLSKQSSYPSPSQAIPRGSHFLRLKGLRPGLYHYKFIVDGTWQVDFLGTTAVDESGNLNNILTVKPTLGGSKQKSTEDLIRLEAALVAFQVKQSSS